MSEENPGIFTVFKGEAERALEMKWRTGFIVVMDQQGRVFVDPNTANFVNKIDHECSTDEAICILQIALNDFQYEKVRKTVASEFASILRGTLSGR